MRLGCLGRGARRGATRPAAGCGEQRCNKHHHPRRFAQPPLPTQAGFELPGTDKAQLDQYFTQLLASPHVFAGAQAAQLLQLNRLEQFAAFEHPLLNQQITQAR